MRQARREEIPAVLALIQERIEWMQAQGLRQWNVGDYLSLYGRAYFGRACSLGQLYVAYRGEQLAGALVLLEEDPRWEADVPAFYVHNFATRTDMPGVGGQMLAYCEALCWQQGKTHLRLDCSVHNGKLNDYYAAKGYAFVSSFIEGDYEGNRREKVVG